jgi:hypothetical protein
LRESIATDRQSEFFREKICNAILEAFALRIRERQIAGVDAGTERSRRVLSGSLGADGDDSAS